MIVVSAANAALAAWRGIWSCAILEKWKMMTLGGYDYDE
jgi:hypothetical protein